MRSVAIKKYAYRSTLQSKLKVDISALGCLIKICTVGVPLKTDLLLLIQTCLSLAKVKKDVGETYGPMDI